MAKSSKNSAPRKVKTPPKPYAGFPLTPHASGKWMKKVRGKIHYFGRWGKVVRGSMERLPGDGWKAALEAYELVRDDLHAGRTPKVKNPDALTLMDLCNRFLTAKTRKRQSGELTHRSFVDYNQTTDRLIDHFGKDRPMEDITPGDFGELRAALAKTWGPTRLSNEITRIKSVFKFAFDNGLVDRPVKYGTEFEKPSKLVMRKHKSAQGKKLIDPATIRKLVEAGDPVMKAAILLAVNCGYGNTDVSNLQQSMIADGWIDFPRTKTGVERRCPLWQETREAIEAAIAVRPAPADEADGDCVFLTVRGSRLVTFGKSKVDRVAFEFAKLAKSIEAHKTGIGFYALRHVFQTIGEEAGETATRFLMGHTDDSMSANYREHIADSRLIAVVEHVRGWLFGKAVQG